jgi:hypothetical protein
MKSIGSFWRLTCERSDLLRRKAALPVPSSATRGFALARLTDIGFTAMLGALGNTCSKGGETCVHSDFVRRSLV